MNYHLFLSLLLLHLVGYVHAEDDAKLAGLDSWTLAGTWVFERYEDEGERKTLLLSYVCVLDLRIAYAPLFNRVVIQLINQIVFVYASLLSVFTFGRSKSLAVPPNRKSKKAPVNIHTSIHPSAVKNPRNSILCDISCYCENR